jgi:hypothetical protein
MGIFRKKLPKILDDPILVDLYMQLEKVKQFRDSLIESATKEEALLLAQECDKFDVTFQTQLPEHFMLRVNQTDLPTYKYIQSWLMDINSIKTIALGAYIIGWSRENVKANKAELEKEFNRVASNMRKSSYGGNVMNLHSSLSYHGIDSNKFA